MKTAVVLISEQGRGTAEKIAALLAEEIVRRTQILTLWNNTDGFA